MPGYNRNIVESGIKHHKPTIICTIGIVLSLCKIVVISPE